LEPVELGEPVLVAKPEETDFKVVIQYADQLHLLAAA
jgi:hypothetical protein